MTFIVTNNFYLCCLVFILRVPLILSVGTLFDALYMKSNTVLEQLLIRFQHESSYINLRDGDGRTALMYASIQGLEGSVELLLRYGANTSIADNTLYTPIDAAAFGGFPIIAKL